MPSFGPPFSFDQYQFAPFEVSEKRFSVTPRLHRSSRQILSEWTSPGPSLPSPGRDSSSCSSEDSGFSSPTSQDFCFEDDEVDRALDETLSPSILANSDGIDEFATGARELNYPLAFYPVTSDRFIPSRRSLDLPSESFRVNKHPQELSPTERLLRRKTALSDPFVRRRLTPRPESQNDTHAHPTAATGNSPRSLNSPGNPESQRVVSAGSVWNVGGVAPPPVGPQNGVQDGHGRLLGSRTNAPMFSSDFFDTETKDESRDRFEGRIAAALDIDPCNRVLDFSPTKAPELRVNVVMGAGASDNPHKTTFWKHGEWVTDRILDAPSLRDDFYCSVLAFCYNSRTLAVGLSNRVYLWSEKSGVSYPFRPEDDVRQVHVTSLSFSSPKGHRSILATGRSNGKISLWSLFETADRFHLQQPSAISCLAFKPVPTRRSYDRSGQSMITEELLAGDELGNVYYYSIGWPALESGYEEGAVKLLAKIDVHNQQICGLAWSPDGDFFATGGNDNSCNLFSVRDVLSAPRPAQNLSYMLPPQLPVPMTGLAPDFVPNAPLHHTLSSYIHLPPHIRECLQHADPRQAFRGPHPSSPIRNPPDGAALNINMPSSPHHMRGPVLFISSGRERHRWVHAAAVKAIAFCPWQRGLLATGGGSNDRAIHFFHTWSGAALATINVYAQVTSLIWSTRRREIAATLGYAQPDHPFRIAVFSWPDCRQVLAVPWASDLRTLYAIPYPGGPNGLGVPSGRSASEDSEDDSYDNDAHEELGQSRSTTADDTGETRVAAAARPARTAPRKRRRPGTEAEGGRWLERTAEEGCIVVASSDESVKFHEVWGGRGSSRREESGPGSPSDGSRTRHAGGGVVTESNAHTGGGGGGRSGHGPGARGGTQAQGGLGWSDILEMEEGVDKDWGEVVR